MQLFSVWSSKWFSWSKIVHYQSARKFSYFQFGTSDTRMKWVEWRLETKQKPFLTFLELINVKTENFLLHLNRWMLRMSTKAFLMSDFDWVYSVCLESESCRKLEEIWKLSTILKLLPHCNCASGRLLKTFVMIIKPFSTW